MQQWRCIDIHLAQNVSGNFLPNFRSDRSYCFTACGFLHPSCCRAVVRRAEAQQRGCRKPQAVKNTVCRSRRWAKNCSKHVELVDINKSSLLHLVCLPHYFILRMHGQTNIKFAWNLLLLSQFFAECSWIVSIGLKRKLLFLKNLVCVGITQYLGLYIIQWLNCSCEINWKKYVGGSDLA
jgi:hypothetical protein